MLHLLSDCCLVARKFPVASPPMAQHNVTEFLSALYVGRVAQTLLACKLLVDHGFSIEVSAVTRPLVESHIRLLFIQNATPTKFRTEAGQGEAAMKVFVEEMRGMSKTVEKIDAHFETGLRKIAPDVLRMKEALKEAHGTAQLTAKEMLESCPPAQTVMFSACSQDSHSGLGVMVTESDEQRKARLGMCIISAIGLMGAAAGLLQRPDLLTEVATLHGRESELRIQGLQALFPL